MAAALTGATFCLDAFLFDELHCDSDNVLAPALKATEEAITTSPSLPGPLVTK